MPIQFRCPYCRKRLSIGDEFGGKIKACDGCNSKLIVPMQRKHPLVTSSTLASRHNFEVRPKHGQPLDTSTDPSNVHDLRNGVCVNCGCSDVFIAAFHPECRSTTPSEADKDDRFHVTTVGSAIGITVALVLLGSLLFIGSSEPMSDDTVRSESNVTSSSSNYESPPSAARYTPSTTNENTEDKLRRVYRSQGIRYDDRMIREDARAIEKLHRDLNQ